MILGFREQRDEEAAEAVIRAAARTGTMFERCSPACMWSYRSRLRKRPISCSGIDAIDEGKIHIFMAADGATEVLLKHGHNSSDSSDRP